MTESASLLREALDRSATSARRLAELTGVHEGRISDYLRGRHVPRGDQLLRLVRALGFDLRLTPDLSRNGIVLAELLDLADALAVGAVERPPAPLPRFQDLIRDHG
jgi:transcriptional regulator with XRE-family HTH domain